MQQNNCEITVWQENVCHAEFSRNGTLSSARFHASLFRLKKKYFLKLKTLPMMVLGQGQASCYSIVSKVIKCSLFFILLEIYLTFSRMMKYLKN
jgi:hypothetical protein